MPFVCQVRASCGVGGGGGGGWRGWREDKVT